MNCNCKWTEIILSVVLLAATWLAIPGSKGIITIAAAILILHALGCKNCGACSNDMKMASQKVAVNKTIKKKKK